MTTESSIQSKLLGEIPGLVHGFGTREEPIPRVFLDSHGDAWSQRPQWKQMHGVGVAQVQRPQQTCGVVDALYTGVSGIPVSVVTADCVPILMARKSPLKESCSASAAAIHAGWRGTRAHIAKVVCDELRSKGEKLEEWVAAIGPAIGPCCYEVSPEIADDFEREFARFGNGLAVPKTRYLDLPAINQAELLACGVGQVEVLRLCTRCSCRASGSEPRFHSYRREGGGGRQFSVVMRI